MEDERYALINRTELAAERADKSGFHETANALRAVAGTLTNMGPAAGQSSSLFQYSD